MPTRIKMKANNTGNIATTIEPPNERRNCIFDDSSAKSVNTNTSKKDIKKYFNHPYIPRCAPTTFFVLLMRCVHNVQNGILYPFCSTIYVIAITLKCAIERDSAGKNIQWSTYKIMYYTLHSSKNTSTMSVRLFFAILGIILKPFRMYSVEYELARIMSSNHLLGEFSG